MGILLKKRFLIVSITLIINLLFQINLFASQKAAISNVQIINTRDYLVVYFKVDNAFTEEISQAVMKGAPASFSFSVTLDQTSSYWFNREIVDYKITSTLKYNVLKKEFIVSRPWKHEKPFTTVSFEEAKKIMTEIDNLAVIRLMDLVKGKQYELKLKADLDKVTLPLYLHYIFFFVSFWDFGTDKSITTFTY